MKNSPRQEIKPGIGLLTESRLLSKESIDPANAAEMARLLALDDLIIDHLGLFPPQIDSAHVHQILDMACGPGGWSMQIAFQYPDMHILGLDRDPTLLRYAQAHAQVQGLENVLFEAIETISALYDGHSFDVVQARFLTGFPRFRADFLNAGDWLSLLATSWHVLQPGGMLRLMETAFLETSSTALALTHTLFLQAIAKREGIENLKITPFLKRWVQDAGYEQIQERIHMLNCSAGERAYIGFLGQIKVAFKLLQPFLIQMGVITQQQIDRLYEHMLIEMMAEDFSAVWFMLEITAQKSW